MDIHFEVVGRMDTLRDLLLARGWRLDESGSNRFTAMHADVKDQRTARARLHQLGLLTCGRLHIEFGKEN